MKTFHTYLQEQKVRKVSPNPAQGISLLSQAKSRLLDLQELPISDETAAFRFESAYAALREALQSFLATAGYKAYSHEAILAYGKEQGLLSESEYQRADRYREIRNDINYRAKPLLIAEAKEAIDFSSWVLEKLTRMNAGTIHNT